MQCDYFDDRRCRSCRLMGVPYPDQLVDKQRTAAAALAPTVPAAAWAEAFASAESGYRNKAKWVVGGSRGAPTIGILDEHREGIDLRECGICEPTLRNAFPVLAEAIATIGLVPYDVNRRSGELKYLIVTASPDGDLMARFVLRSADQLPSVRRALPDLQAALPRLAVLSVNLHPEHKAVVEGEQEIVLTERETLPMRLNDLTLHLRPRSFFQTNTAVAAGLYRQAAAWVADLRPTSVLDLYCGVGGFALHCAPADAVSIRGVEVSAEAVASAGLSATEVPGPDRFDFTVADAGAEAVVNADLVIVNPPRRGLGEALVNRLEHSNARHLIYSSCNVTSLARDLAGMPSWGSRHARLFDMFPQTPHVEVAVLLERR